MKTSHTSYSGVLPDVFRALAIALLISALLGAPLSAQTTYTWDAGGVNNDWGTAGNWVGDTVPTFNTDAVVLFDTNVGGRISTFLGAQRQVRGITFGANLTGGVNALFDIQTRTTQDGATGANLLFNGGATNASITLDAGLIISRVRLGAGAVGVISLQTTTDLFHNASGTLFQFDANTTGAGSLNKHGAGTVTFTRVNSYNGLNLYGGSAVVWNNASALGTNNTTLGETGSSSNVSLFFGSTQTYTNAITVSSGSGTRLIGNTDVTNQIGLGAITGNATLSGGIDLSAGKDVTLAITNYNASTDRLTVSGAVTGTGGVTKTGNGILILTGTGNSYSGTTDIQGGKLYLGGAGRLGSGAVTIASGANLDFGTGAAQTNIVANNISGAGSILQSTASTDTRLTGDVTSTGGLTINNGTLRIGNGGITGSYSGDTVVNSGAALVFARSNAYTHSGTISGAGNVTKVNAGDVTLTASNSYSGATTMFQGSLVAGHANALGTGNITFSTGAGGGSLRYTAASAGTDWASRLKNSGAAIQLDTAGNNVSLAGVIDDSNVGGLVKSGLGTLTLGGANTYTGATTVGGGTLLINGSTASGSLLTVAQNATLGGSGTIGGAATINGILAPGNSIGTLTTVGDVTWNSSVGNNWVFELGAAGLSLATPGTSDFLSVGGNFLRGTGSAWTFDFAGTGDLGWYKLVEWSGTSNFELSNFSGVNLGGGFDSNFAIQDDALYVNVVPEPSTYALLALAAAGLGAHVVRRRHKR